MVKLLFSIGCIIIIVSTSMLVRSFKKNTNEEHTEPEKPEKLGNKLRVLNADELIEKLSLKPIIENIKRNLGLSDENWCKDAIPLLHNFIILCQRLPASESHHHAGDGGLVKHTLDVATLALTASASYSFPPGAKTEEIARLTSVWKFGILIASLLHDVGKVVTGFKIDLFDSAGKNKTQWFPESGNMAETGLIYYQIELPKNKVAYEKHTELGWLFFQSIVPRHCRQWIAESDENLLILLRQYLSGDHESSILQKIIKQADMASVARDLKTGTRQRLTIVKRIPLIETVMDTLIEMLREKGAYFSVATTAGGDLFRQDDVVFMISKTVPDAVRDFLRKNNHPAAASFPTENQRIFDTLLEYDAVIANPQYPNKAVSLIDVTFAKSDGEIKRHQFTVLSFKTKILFPDGNFPENFQGQLELVSSSTEVKQNSVAKKQENNQPKSEEKLNIENENNEKTKTNQLVQDIDTLLNESGCLLSEEDEEDKEDSKIDKENKEEVVPSKPKSTRSGLDSLKDFLSNSNIETAIKNKNKEELLDTKLPDSEIEKHEVVSTNTPSPRPISVKQKSDILTAISEIQINEILTENPKPSPTNGNHLQEEGRKFWAWLANGLNDGSILYNESGSPIHFIEKGMLLVSPGIFRLYAGTFNKNDVSCPGLLAQKGFVSLGFHERTRRTALFFAVGKKNNKTLFRCYLIPENHLYHIIRADSRPPNNHELSVVTDDLLTQKEK